MKGVEMVPHILVFFKSKVGQITRSSISNENCEVNKGLKVTSSA